VTGVAVEPVAAPLTGEMADLLAALHARGFTGVTGAAWSAPALRSILDMPASRAWLSRMADRPGGLLLARAAGDDAEILTFGVVPEERRRGHGRALITAAAVWARDLGLDRLVLEVAVSNAPALAFYRRCGFTEAGRRNRYYDTPSGRVDAYVFAAQIEKP
jgi:ribosomal-protein-alanine N-acetyltransferase